jgi:hypothetical protein
MDDIMHNAHRIKALGLLVSGLLVATAVSAQSAQQGAVAHLKGVTGNVLVSQQEGLSTGSESQQLVNGTRIITTANSEVVVVFDKGCEVRLKENQRLDIDSGKPCALMIAEALGGQPVAAVGVGLVPLLLPLGGGAIVVSGTRGGSTPVSPN